MAKRSVRDMLKARAWKGQVSLADVDPGDHLGVKRKKIAVVARPRPTSEAHERSSSGAGAVSDHSQTRTRARSPKT